MKKRRSKYCICKIAIPNYKGDDLFCNKCKKAIRVKGRKIWKINPATKIEKNKKGYDRKTDQNKFKLDIKEGETYE